MSELFIHIINNFKNNTDARKRESDTFTIHCNEEFRYCKAVFLLRVMAFDCDKLIISHQVLTWDTAYKFRCQISEVS